LGDCESDIEEEEDDDEYVPEDEGNRDAPSGEVNHLVGGAIDGVSEVQDTATGNTQATNVSAKPSANEMLEPLKPS
jgi:hypothetical protein